MQKDKGRRPKPGALSLWDAVCRNSPLRLALFLALKSCRSVNRMKKPRRLTGAEFAITASDRPHAHANYICL